MQTIIHPTTGETRDESWLVHDIDVKVLTAAVACCRHGHTEERNLAELTLKTAEGDELTIDIHVADLDWIAGYLADVYQQATAEPTAA